MLTNTEIYTFVVHCVGDQTCRLCFILDKVHVYQSPSAVAKLACLVAAVLLLSCSGERGAFTAGQTNYVDCKTLGTQCD